MKKATVLIVEDEAIVAADIAIKLRQQGYEVAGVATSGEGAVEQACRFYPHIVLMDVRLQGDMDGPEAAEAIRRRIDVPVIFLTSHSDEMTLERAKAAGPYGYVLKPFEARDLATQIEMALYKHQSDRKLRESEERLRLASDAAQLGVFEWDLDADTMHWENARMFEIFGRTPEDGPYTGASFYGEAIVPEDRADFENALRIARRHGGAFNPVFHIRRHGDGARRRVALSGRLDLTQDRFPRRLVGIVADITERERMEQTVGRQREMLQRIVDNIPVLLIMWDPSLEQFTLNKKAESVLGVSTEEANRCDLMAMCYPDPEYRRQVAGYMQSLESGWREIATTTSSGEVLPIDWANIRLTDDTMIGIGIDLRERKQAEADLRASEDRLRRAMIAGRVFTFEWQAATGETLRSDNAAAILGLAADRSVRTTSEAHFDRIEAADREAFAELLARLDPEHPEYETEYRYVRGDGRTIWLEESGCAEFDDMGNLFRIRGVAADVSDRIESAERAKRAAATVAAARSAVDTVDAMGEGVVLFGLDGVISAVNPAAEHLTGIPKAESVGKHLREILPRILEARDLEMAEAALGEALEGRTPALRHVVLRGEGVSAVCISPSVAFIRDAAGKPVSGVLTLKDVTDLHETHQLLEQIFDNTYVHVAYLDTDFNFVRVNRTYAQANGRNPEFYAGKNHFACFPHDENEAIFRRVRDTGEPYFVYEKPFDVGAVSELGVTYWDWNLRPIRNDNGEIEGLLLCLLDATERVRTRMQFIESEARYRELVENANSIIMRITPDHRITFFNEYAQHFFGYTPEEVIGRNVLGTITPVFDSYGRDMRELLRLITGEPELHGSNENENMCKDGRRVWVHWSNRAVRDEHGDVREILCVGTDVSQRKQLEEEAEAYRGRLRELAERLAVSEEQQRREVSTQIHDTVIQTLSLANIRLGAIRAALEAGAEREHRDAIDQVRQLVTTGVSECRGLMADLTPPLLYELGLVPALEDFAEKQSAMYAHAIDVEDDGQAKPLNEAHRGFLFQAARELVMNAIKHSGEGRIRIRAGRDGSELCLEVVDDGGGFDPALVELFAPDSEGGFGLFNIRERLQQLGGTLAIDSAPGQGTRVTIRAPLDTGV